MIQTARGVPFLLFRVYQAGAQCKTMQNERQEDLFDPERRDPEGLFDAQLPLPIPSLLGPEPFRAIVKRDGRLEPFAREKIARAIVLAGQAAGLDTFEIAGSLASAVAIFLNKRLGAQPPTADQVSDAVEKVLLEMAQGETALAFARFRDRRARIRQLRDGDATALFSEWEEARHEREALSGRHDRVLAVRTSTETLVHWNRERIVAALMRETGLERAKAEMIAMEVERQLQRAHIETLTTSLVRELVDAKLVEHGLGTYRERHRRLGVPLYDCERILLGITEETIAQDPAGTDQALARAVKKEYALAQVFPPAVAEAHLRGDIHLHGLGLADRLYSIVYSPAAVARFGIRLPGGMFAGPPRHPQTFLAQWVKCNALLQNLFAEPLAWDAVNFHFAPFLGAFEGSDLRQFAQMLVYEFAYRALTDGQPAHGTELHVYWSAPDHLRDREAIGAGGSLTGKTYGQYQFLAQQFADALLDVIIEGNVNGEPLAGPILVISIDSSFYQATGHKAFLDKIARAVALRRMIHLAFPETEAGETSSPADKVWSPRMLASHQVTLNLPRAAMVAGEEEAFYRELDRLMGLAVAAHEHKTRFLEKLVCQPGGGPLALLAVEDGCQSPLINLDDAVGLIAVEGLNECVQVLCGEAMHTGGAAMRFAERILDYLHASCLAHRKTSGPRLILTQNHAPEVSQRFATLDMRNYPEQAAPLAAMDPDTQTLHYTTGARLRLDARLRPMERMELSEKLQKRLQSGAMTEIAFPASEMTESAITDFIRQTSDRKPGQRMIIV